MKKNGFSLIELSVILLVIGILAVAITKGGSLLQSARISSAQSKAASSKISEIDGLVAWYETVMDDSLDSASRIDNSSVSYWQDISSQYNISEEINRLDGPGNSKIVYRRDGISNFPKR